MMKFKENDRVTFKFAGGTFLGVVNEKDEKLSTHYGEEWYWLYETSTGTRFPIAHHAIIDYYRK